LRSRAKWLINSAFARLLCTVVTFVCLNLSRGWFLGSPYTKRNLR